MAYRGHDAFMQHALVWAERSQGAVEVGSPDDPAASPVEAAEAFILAQAPRSVAEMIIQLEIICDDLDEGHRCDGLDVVAIRNIQRALLDTVVPDQSVLRRFASIRAGSPAGPLGPFRDHELRITN